MTLIRLLSTLVPVLPQSALPVQVITFVLIDLLSPVILVHVIRVVDTSELGVFTSTIPTLYTYHTELLPIACRIVSLVMCGNTLGYYFFSELVNRPVCSKSIWSQCHLKLLCGTTITSQVCVVRIFAEIAFEW